MAISTLPTRLTRDAYLAHRKKVAEDGLLFPLPASSIGLPVKLEAHVRRINTTDRAAIEALPTAVQEVVWRGIKEFERQTKAARPAQSLIEAATKNEEQMTAANAFCIAAVLDIREEGVEGLDDVVATGLVATEAELEATPGAWLVHDVAAEDRISFFYACIDADSASAKQLRAFRGQPSVNVPDRTAGGLDPITPIVPVESAG